jgi:serine/threonine protein kinase
MRAQVRSTQHMLRPAQSMCIGGSIAQLLAAGEFTRRRGRGPRVSRVLVALRHIAVALSHLHGQGVCHGALRPSQVLVHVTRRSSTASDPRGHSMDAADRAIAEAARGLDSGASTCKLTGAGLNILGSDTCPGEPKCSHSCPLPSSQASSAGYVVTVLCRISHTTRCARWAYRSW